MAGLTECGAESRGFLARSGRGIELARAAAAYATANTIHATDVDYTNLLPLSGLLVLIAVSAFGGGN